MTRSRPLLREVVVETIRAQIIDGTYPPGARLVEDRLGEKLGVSRVPVREALRMLESEGFVEMLPHRGAVVAALSVKDIADIFDVRSALEAVVARSAARRATPESVAAIQEVVHRAKAALAAGPAAELVALNARFHEQVLDLAGNAYLSDVLLPLRGRMQRLFREVGPARAAVTLVEHGLILDAIAAGDEDTAAARAAAHVEAVRRAVGDPASS